MKLLSTLIAAITLAAVSVQVSADESAMDKATKFDLGIYLNLGGDELAKVDFDDGSDSTVNAGGGAHFVFGVRHTFDGQFGVVGRLGYLTDGVKADDAFGRELDISFSTFTFDAMGSYTIDKHEIAGGVTYQPSPEYEIKYAGDSVTVEFDAAIGLLVEYRYKFTDNFGGDIRYT